MIILYRFENHVFTRRTSQIIYARVYKNVYKSIQCTASERREASFTDWLKYHIIVIYL